ncbi:MAG: carbohydrate ABC transporter permease [Chloroflexota bacterium]|nr:MAG: carbohydrate ABC transporter permease [Chloroflexota bacterium]
MIGERIATRSSTMAGSRTTIGRITRRSLMYLLAGFLVILFMGPFLWTLSSSLKNAQEIALFPPTLLPRRLRFENYAEVFQTVPMWTFIRNSVQVSVLAVIGQVITATLVAYGFSRFRFPGRNALFMVLISTMILPREVLLIPSFLLFKFLGMINTLTPLWIPSFFGGAFYVFLLRQFFMTLPQDLDEAAKIDGANSFQILAFILVPLCQPAMATVAIFAFLAHWNEFLEPLIYLSSKENFTLALGLRFFQQIPNDAQEPRDQLMMAASLVMTTPVLALFFVAQRYFIRGIVMSGIKG